MTRWFVVVGAVGCAHRLPDDQVCLEVGWAIGARTSQCEGDPGLGVARTELFEQSYVCALPELAFPEEELDLYACALTVRNLACELVLQYGDDLDAWLASTPACAAILDPA